MLGLKYKCNVSNLGTFMIRVTLTITYNMTCVVISIMIQWLLFSTMTLKGGLVYTAPLYGVLL